MEQSPEYHTLESDKIGTLVLLTCCPIDELCNNPSYQSCFCVICIGRMIETDFIFIKL